jgi:hypothetical protein
MKRRGWMPIRHDNGQWYASKEAMPSTDNCGPCTVPVQPGSLYADPFTALVEANRWAKDHGF